jgi:hypothetical protein
VREQASLFAVGFSIGLSSSTAGKVIIVFYWATLVPGLVTGVRMARYGPDAALRGGWGGGCGAALVSPLATGVCLGYLAMTLGRDFPGEADARRIAEKGTAS